MNHTIADQPEIVPLGESFSLSGVLRDLPLPASFVYERMSTHDRRPTQSFLGFGKIPGTLADASEPFASLRAAIEAGDGQGGVLAFLSYEALTGGDAPAPTPRALIVRPDVFVAIDHRLATARICGGDPVLRNSIRAALLTSSDEDTGPLPSQSADEDVSKWTCDRNEAEFVADASALKDVMHDRGDIAGAALSVALSRPFDGSAFDAYRVLRRINPSTCMFYVVHRDFALWGATSLPVLSVRDDRLVAETDGATRRVDPGETEPWQPDAKENAEYDLVVEALRSDLEDVIEPGSLRFIADREARQYFNLQHLFAEVEGRLGDGTDAVEALRRLTPHGAATGYPKTAAIDLIDRYDGKPRGPYAGAIGVFLDDGSADAACVIRSAWLVGGKAHTRAGAKIVPASDPASEYREGVMKTLPLRRSIAAALVR